MSPLSILILSDGRPGHYHLAEGVVAAIARRRPVEARRIEISRRRTVPSRALAKALAWGVPPRVVLGAGYGLAAAGLPKARLVVSAGGDTIAAAVAAARILGARNIFCGSLRHVRPEDVDLVVSSYERHRDRPRHLVALKPSSIDPDALAPSGAGSARLGPGHPPKRAGLLVGGPSGLFRWRDDEWDALLTFPAASEAATGTRWVVSTSRRTPDRVADALQRLASAPSGPIDTLIDYRSAGPGTLPRLFASVDAILATEDSSTMLSEAVAARLPVVGVAPIQHSFKDEEREYRDLMLREGWCRSLPLQSLTPTAFLVALGEIRPLTVNPLDRLAAALAERLPDLFADAGQ